MTITPMSIETVRRMFTDSYCKQLDIPELIRQAESMGQEQSNANLIYFASRLNQLIRGDATGKSLTSARVLAVANRDFCTEPPLGVANCAALYTREPNLVSATSGT